MKIEFVDLNEKNFESAIDCVYECWKDNSWFKASGKSEKDIKQSIFDRMHNASVFELSIVAIDRENNDKVVGGYFARRLDEYMQAQQYWNFHKHFEIIEEFIETLGKQLSLEQQQQSIWTFWLSSTVQGQRIPELLINEVGSKAAMKGFQYIVGFINHSKSKKVSGVYKGEFQNQINLSDIKSKKGEKPQIAENISLFPVISKLDVAYERVQQLHEIMKDTDWEFYKYIDRTVRWNGPNRRFAKVINSEIIYNKSFADDQPPEPKL